MYPEWIDEICRNPCECRGVPSAGDIVAIGIARPIKGAEFMGPMAMVTVVCPNCGLAMNITVREPLKSVIAAMQEFTVVIENIGRSTPPPINLPTGDQHSGNKYNTVLEPNGAILPLRPSVRKNQPATPPTQQEIQHFLQRLRKTSFKRRSRGFKDWMKGFGVDTDGSIDDNSK